MFPEKQTPFEIVDYITKFYTYPTEELSVTVCVHRIKVGEYT